MGELIILTPADGDIRLHWDPDESESVKKAEEEWDKLMAEGYEFFNPQAKRRTRLKKFNKRLGQVLVVPGVMKPEEKKPTSQKRPKAMSGGPNQVDTPVI